MRSWLQQGVIDRCTQFSGRHAYTFLYYKAPLKPEPGERRVR